MECVLIITINVITISYITQLSFCIYLNVMKCSLYADLFEEGLLLFQHGDALCMKQGP
uniref:Uncharacterized protein n=1 Tax=Anguilla anguilla TaxID=7936 RepID=A0A0E9S5S1_ANGAN